MKTRSSKALTCAVCGIQSGRRANWFLVVENPWLDRIKILSWHPVLAEQDEIQSVCGKHHLQILITHWLTYANLHFVRSRTPEFALTAEENLDKQEREFLPHGRFVGELAVHRESFSRIWTGSPEERESIFEALIGKLELRQTETGTETTDHLAIEPIAIPDSASAYLHDYAVQ